MRWEVHPWAAWGTVVYLEINGLDMETGPLGPMEMLPIANREQTLKA